MPTDPPIAAARRPLLLTEDATLLERLLRLVAVAGAEAVVLQSTVAARSAWPGAPLVLVGDDLASAVASAGLSRRPGVVLVGRDLDDAGVWRRAVDIGADHVVVLPDGEPWLIDRLTEVADGGARGTLLAVVGGRGGAGATVTAAALAVTGLRLGHRTMLVDGDPLGGGIDLVLGGEASDGLRWSELTGARGRLAADSLYEALPQVGELTVLSCGRSDGADVPTEAMTALLDAGLRGSDLVVVDLARHLTEAARAALELADTTLLVVPAELCATAAAARVAAAVRDHSRDTRLLVRGPAPSGLDAETVASVLELPLAGQIRAEPGLAAALERGDPPGRRTRSPLATFCAGFLGEVVPQSTRRVARSSAELAATVRERLARDGSDVNRASVAAAVRAASALSGDLDLLARVDQVESELVGLGPLQVLADDREVTDILVNGPDQVWVERCGRLERTAVTFAGTSEVRGLAQRLAAGAGRRLDDAQPWADVRLAGGARLHAVLPPIAVDGPVLSVRLPRRRAFTLDELVSAGTFPAPVARLLAALVARRRSFLVTGGTGSGKTTLLSTLLSAAAPGERVVLVEDLAELRPDLVHLVRLEARPANAEGAGRVTLQDLVRQALRMRPDRLVVGEVRGAEVVDLLAALNTGHEGGCGTVHADSAQALPARIEALATAAGLGRAAAHSQLAAAVDVVVHLRRGADGVRRLQTLGVLRPTSHGLAAVVTGVDRSPDGHYVEGPGWPDLAALLDRPATSWPLR